MNAKLRRQIFGLAIPFLFQELIIVMTALMTAIMVEPFVGKYVVAGIGASSSIYFLYNITTGAIVFIGNLFISQHYGKGKFDLVEKDFYASLKFVAALSIVFFILSISIPDKLIAIFVPGQTLSIQYGAKYLQIFSISFLFTGMSFIYYCLMKNVNLEKWATTNSLITLITLVILNATFLFGFDLGLQGAATAVVVSRFIELVINIVIVERKSQVTFHIKKFFRFNKATFQSFAKKGGALMAGKMSWALGFLMTSVVIGQLGNPSISAADAIITNAINIIMCLPNCMSNAIGVIAGRALGANKLEEAKNDTDSFLKLLAIVDAIAIVIFLIMLPIALAIHPNLDDESKRYLFIFFFIVAVVLIPRCINGPLENGILNAGGDTLYITLLDGFTDWCTAIPLGIIGIKFNWNPVAVYCALQIEELIKLPINLWRYKTYKWVKNINQIQLQ